MFFSLNKRRKPEVALGIDIGASQIKAAVIRRERDGFELLEYAVHNVPSTAAKAYRGPEFATELQKTIDGMKTSERHAYVTISCSSAMVCQAEFPPVPLEEIKSALKLNSAGYLRRDFSSYYLDAFELKKGPQDSKGRPKEPDKSKDAAKTKDGARAKDAENKPKEKDTAKKTVLVGGANKEEVDACREALTTAKIKPQVIELAAISVINAFQVGHPEIKDDVVVLVDIGARMTSVNFLQGGLPLITRIMHFGGLQLTEYIGQVLMLKPQEAEEEKRKMSPPVQELVKTAISPLAREIRSSIDFFERQNDLHVQRIYACGGSACSAPVLAILGEAVGTTVECWNTVDSLDVSQFNGGTRRVHSIGPSLAGAVGVAVSRLS
ncbi:MAG TPA: pilus assembly protein PilM [Verrucomicrobiae bacterium]|nr:pilus assembly protein PilM [Verrucomicrobiae bacterium]